MDKKNNEDLQGQLEFESISDKPGSYLDDLEDIFATTEGQEELIDDGSIYWCRCDYCEQVIAICDKCREPVEKDDKMYCIDLGKKHREHYCEKCMKKWALSNACMPKKWKLTEKGKHYIENHKPNIDSSG
ncbi:hypothetical protein ES703_45394 [subsurface metagenome]